MKALLCSNLLGKVVVVFHVGDRIGEVSILANPTILWWICQDVFWLNHHFLALIVAEILLQVLILLHVLVGGIGRLSDVLTGLERLFISYFDLTGTVLFTKHLPSCGFKWVSNSVIRGLHEQDFITVTLFHWSSSNVRWVNHDLLCVRVGIDSC